MKEFDKRERERERERGTITREKGPHHELCPYNLFSHSWEACLHGSCCCVVPCSKFHSKGWQGVGQSVAQGFAFSVILRLTFPRAKLRRQIFMTRAEELGEELGEEFSAHFRASFAVQNDTQIFSQNSSQFITPCLVAEILQFHLRELLGFGGHSVICASSKAPFEKKSLRYLGGSFAPWLHSIGLPTYPLGPQKNLS